MNYIFWNSFWNIIIKYSSALLQHVLTVSTSQSSPTLSWFFFFFSFNIFFYVDHLKSLYWICTILLLIFIFCFFFFFNFWLQNMWDLSFLTRDWTCTLCIGKWSLNHWTTREVPLCWALLIVFVCILLQRELREAECQVTWENLETSWNYLRLFQYFFPVHIICSCSLFAQKSWVFTIC